MPRPISSWYPATAASQASLPFGAVMATGGAAHLAGAGGASAVAEALLWLAIAQGIWVTWRGLYRCRCALADALIKWWARGSPRQHAGRLTIPLGLAVITAGLVPEFGSSAASPVTAASLILAWLATLAGVGRFILSLRNTTFRLGEIGGEWFLVPAALLGAAVATSDALPSAVSGFHIPLAELAAAAAITGFAGYWIVLASAGLRLLRHGLDDSQAAPWWIAMGCAGLAAAALAGVARTGAGEWLAAFQAPLQTAMTIAFITGLALAVPVIALSLDFLCRHCRFTHRASWPPTFSTAVLAMGGLGVATVLDSHVFSVLGTIAGWATLALWATSSAWNLGLFIRRLGRFATDGRS